MNKRIDTILDFVLILSTSIFFPKPSLHGCEFSSFSSGSKVRARREMPTSGPGGVSAEKKPLSVAPFPRGKGCRIRFGPLLKMLPMERRKTMLRLCVVSPVPRTIFHSPASIPAVV